MNTGSGGTTKDIMSVNGFADTATQDTFSGTARPAPSLFVRPVRERQHAQDGKRRHHFWGTYSATNDFESSATKGTLTVGGHKVYSLYMNAREGYRTPWASKARTCHWATWPRGSTSSQTAPTQAPRAAGTSAMCPRSHGLRHHEHDILRNRLLGQRRRQRSVVHGRLRRRRLGRRDGSLDRQQPSSSPSMKVSYALGILHTPVGQYALRMADAVKPPTSRPPTTGPSPPAKRGATRGRSSSVWAVTTATTRGEPSTKAPSPSGSRQTRPISSSCRTSRPRATESRPRREQDPGWPSPAPAEWADALSPPTLSGAT